jgi:hypothetical protein
MRALVLACALLVACGDVETQPDASGVVDDAGDVDAGCAPCGNGCDAGVCHPAGTPPSFCQACSP